MCIRDRLRGISTFMSEMLEASCMLKIATKNSLLIVDELGRGTSTTEGFGIAWGIAEYIVKNIQCFCLFATHFHEMTTMETHFSGVKNFYVSAVSKQKTLTMLYKVKPGAVDRSYGIYVAEILQFPEEILNDARRRANDLEAFEKKMAEDGNIEEEESDILEGESEEKPEDKMEVESQSLRSLAKNATMKQKEKAIAIYQEMNTRMIEAKNPEEKQSILKELKEKVMNVLKGK
eukprot:TRINITY_DN2347_c0_g1_i2.p1 TRINITY_DN2347_c0_g1~~TRINITY_DN2347_c0_g1_i2.p1  ORF type:complete len:233 (+),score=54.71 TRINITY_DN2347_c0_g1_i2:65-763(+)